MGIDGIADKITKLYKQVCTPEETKNVPSFNKMKYKVIISIGTVATEIHSVNCVFDTGAGPNLIWEIFLRQGWHKVIRPAHEPDVKTALSKFVPNLGTITLYVSVSDCRVCVNFGVVRNLAVSVLFGATFIDWIAKAILPAERKLVPYNSKPVPVLFLTIQKTKDEYEHSQHEHSIAFMESDDGM